MPGGRIETRETAIFRPGLHTCRNMVCLPACLLSACLSVCLPAFCLSACLPVCLLPVCLPACLPACLSFCCSVCVQVLRTGSRPSRTMCVWRSSTNPHPETTNRADESDAASHSLVTLQILLPYTHPVCVWGGGASAPLTHLPT